MYLIGDNSPIQISTRECKTFGRDINSQKKGSKYCS